MPSSVAYHEAGHAIVAMALSVSVHSAIVRRDGSGEVRHANPNDDRLGTRIMDAAIALAGSIAGGSAAPLSNGDRENIMQCRLDWREQRVADSLARWIVANNRGAIDDLASALDRVCGCEITGTMLEERYRNSLRRPRSLYEV